MDEPTNELARLRAELKLVREWLSEAKRELHAAHVEIGELTAANRRLADLAMNRGNRR